MGYEELANYEELAAEYEEIANNSGSGPAARAMREKAAQARAKAQGGGLGGVAQDFRNLVQSAVFNATVNTAFKPGTTPHFRASFSELARRTGTSIDDNARRAVVVAYRAATRGPAAAVQAAQTAGIPQAVATQIAAPQSADVLAAAVEGGPSARAQRPLVRPIQTNWSGRRKVRRPGEDVPQFGGIFSKAAFGRRARWKQYQ
jgi:hypothetical protein